VFEALKYFVFAHIYVVYYSYILELIMALANGGKTVKILGLNPEEQASAADQLRQYNKLMADKIREDNLAAANSLRENNLSASNNLREDNVAASNNLRQDNQTKASGISNLDNINRTKSAGQAEKMASQQGNTLSGFYKELKQRKQESDKYTGRMGFKKDGLSSINIDNPRARKEKWGRETGSMKNLMGDIYGKAKEAKKKGALAKVKGEVEDMAANAISVATSELLQKSWLNAIDSYGLTVILYINFHVFCRFVFGAKFFCKLGHEWAGGKTGGEVGGAAKTASKSSGSGVIKSFFGMPFDVIGIAEAALLGLVDALILFSILISITPYIIMAYIIDNPAKALWENFGVFWEAIKVFSSVK